MMKSPMETVDYQNPEDEKREWRANLRARIFGFGRREMWNVFATEIDARREAGGWLYTDRVVAELGAWQLVLDADRQSKHQHTRLRAAFMNLDNFRFRVYRKTAFSDLGKLLGMQDIEIGVPFFDGQFIIQGNAPEKVKRLLSDHGVRTLIAAQPDVFFETRDFAPPFIGQRAGPGIDVLTFMALGTISDPDQLHDLFTLFTETLVQLVEMGCAEDYPPGVQL
jgi:hypothetical protein